MSHEALAEFQDIEVLLLDLGGVIIDIEPERSSRAFEELGGAEALGEHSKAEQDELFDRLERGEIDADTFRRELRERTGIRASDQELDEAWNALLLGIPMERFRFLERAARSYRLHLFSNTNAIHIKGFERIVEARYGMEAFRKLFEGIHLSYEMGVRKPEDRAFELILERIATAPERILFVDDTEAHLKSAARKGIRTYHLKEGTLSELEKKFPQPFS